MVGTLYNNCRTRNINLILPERDFVYNVLSVKSFLLIHRCFWFLKEQHFTAFSLNLPHRKNVVILAKLHKNWTKFYNSFIARILSARVFFSLFFLLQTYRQFLCDSCESQQTFTNSFCTYTKKGNVKSYIKYYLYNVQYKRHMVFLIHLFITFRMSGYLYHVKFA